ncbi:MAG: hypothetical protein IJT27_07025 [Clostridia bacterium]|nr:hypothetical protein [Clostridia bacterium]
MRLTDEQFYAEVLRREEKEKHARRRRSKKLLLTVPAVLLTGFLFGVWLQTIRPADAEPPAAERQTAAPSDENATGAPQEQTPAATGSPPAETRSADPGNYADLFSLTDSPTAVTVDGVPLPENTAGSVYRILQDAVLHAEKAYSAQASLSAPPEDAVSFDLTIGENTNRWTVYPYILACADMDLCCKISPETYRTLFDLLN